MNWIVMEITMRRIGLTEREREVARLYTSGLRRQEIASVMYLEEKTAQNHLTAVYRKAGIPGGHGGHRKVQLLRILQGLRPSIAT
jgi:DNA-binding NarL/FixJ family response regulator